MRLAGNHLDGALASRTLRCQASIDTNDTSTATTINTVAVLFDVLVGLGVGEHGGRDATPCADVYRRASGWCERNGLTTEAIHYATLAGDHARAADLIERHVSEALDAGRLALVREWVLALPAAVLATRPMLHVWLAWVAELTHQVEDLEEHLQSAEERLQVQALDDHTQADVVRGHCLALRAGVARRARDNAAAIGLATRSLALLGDDDAWARAFAELSLGLARLDVGELQQAQEAFARVAATGKAASSGIVAMLATAQLAAVYILQGRQRQAERLCRQTIADQQAEHGAAQATLCLIFARLGWVLAERNDVQGYFDATAQAVVLADRIGYRALVQSAAWSMAWESDLLAEQGYDVTIPEHVRPIVDRVVAEGLAVGDGAQVIDAVVDSSQSIVDNTRVYLHDDAYFQVFPGYTDLARARALAADGHRHRALDLLDDVYAAADKADGKGLMIEACVSRALIHHNAGDLGRALEALEMALALSEALGYVRTYADRGRPMAELLLHAATRTSRPAYVARLLDALGDHVPTRKDAPGLERAVGQPLVEPLTPRELDVLRLVAQGLSNREICDTLYLALSTVKGHNQRIFAKLQVSRRTEAVAKARDLGLI